MHGICRTHIEQHGTRPDPALYRGEAKRAAQAEQRAWDSGLRKLSNKICEVLDNGVCTFDASGYLVPAR